MEDLNKVVLIGRLTKDAELKKMDSGSARMDFSVAFTTTKKGAEGYQDESNFVNLSLWGKVAEAICPRMVKGQQVAIEGKLKQERWEREGQKHYELRIIPSSVQLIGGKKDSAPSEQKEPGYAQDYSDIMF